MGRRALVVAFLVASALIASAPTAYAGVNVLLLPDGPGAGVDSLVAALETAGHTVRMGPTEYTWDGTNPPTSGFDVVVHLNGKTWAVALPVAGQQALVDFVRFGGGYVGGQWNGFEAATGLLVDMDDLVLQLWPYPDNCVGCSVTWTIVPGMEDHPVLEGILGYFTFFAGAHDAGPLAEFEEYPSTVLMTSPGGGPAVTVREFESGRVVAFSSAANYFSDLTLDEFFIQLLYVNAVSWAASAPTPSTIDALAELVAALQESGALNKGQANALMSKLDAASKQIERGNLKVAENQMWVFVNQVEAWLRVGVLTLGEAQPLLDCARAIIDNLVG
jgi:hypothetical protein